MAGSRRSVISVLITGDNSGLNRSLEDSQSRLASFGKAAGKAMAAAGVAIAGASVIIGRQAVNAASDLEESINAINVVFGEAAEGMLKLSETAATSVGLSAREFNAFAVQFGAFTKTIAGSEGDVVAVTDELTTRIADFASVMNLDVPEAAQVFQSSLAGETEPIRRFGIDLSAAAIGLHAVETGLVESAKDMTEADKVMARYSKLMADTALMAGDFANTSDGLANSQRILKARLDDTLAALGEALLPVVTTIAQLMINRMVPAFERFAEWFRQNEGTITAFGETVLAGISTAIGFVGDQFTKWRPKVAEAIDFVRTKAGDFQTFWNERISAPVDVARIRINTFVDRVKTALSGMVSDLEPTLRGFLDFFRNLDFDDPKALGERLGEVLSNALEQALESLGELSGKIRDALSRLFAGIDWTQVGVQAATFLVQFGVGLAAGLLSFDWLVPVLQGIAANWQVFAGAILTILFAPAKWAGALGKALMRIPFVGRILNWLVTSINTVGAGLRARIALLFETFTSAFLTALRGGGPTFTRMFVDFLMFLPRTLARIFDDLVLNLGISFQRFGTAFGTGVRNLITTAGEWLGRLMAPFTNFGRTLIDDLFALGKNIIDALIRGIRSMAGALADQVRSIGRSVWDGLSRLWRISSPSKVFMDIGENAMLGLALGMENSARMVADAVRGVGMSVTAVPDIAQGGASVGGPVNVTVNVHGGDPEAVVEAIRRYTRTNGPLGQVVTL